ncbi:hypothetical protein [Phocaeicola salanitronis]|uniref:hypothetical protein n=1 Tax=Phocaeicola salanitronis TaxID=376805 RepID=UPI0023FA160C|nr:hypothetical protein [Phocaeicola salanitronis]
MRKKYLSALLFGALLFASAGTFTSCKDYDDDINNLNQRVDQIAADLNDLKTKVDALGCVESIEFSNGQLIVHTASGDVSASMPEYTGIKEVKLEGNTLYVDGVEAGKVELTGEDGETIHVPVITVNDGKLYVDDQLMDIEIGSNVVLVDNGDTCTLTVDGQTVTLMKSGAELTAIQIEDLEASAFTDVKRRSNGIQWGVAAKATPDWAGTKGAIAMNQLLIGQISTVNVQVTPADYDLGAQELALVDARGNKAPVNVEAVANNLLLPASRAASSNGSWILTINIDETQVNAANIADIFKYDPEDSKNKDLMGYTLCVNGKPYTTFDFSVKTAGAKSANKSVIKVNNDTDNLMFIDANGRVKEAGEGKIPVGTTTLYVADSDLYDYYLTFEGTNKSLANQYGIKIGDDKKSIVVPAGAEGVKIAVTVHTASVTGQISPVAGDATNENQVTLQIAGTEIEAAEVAAVTHQIKPAATVAEVLKEIRVDFKTADGKNVFESFPAANLEAARQSGQFKVVEDASQVGFLVVSGDPKNGQREIDNRNVTYYKADNTLWQPADDLLDLSYMKIKVANKVAEDAVPGNYQLTFIATENDNATVLENELVKVTVPVAITVPTFDELFAHDQNWTDATTYTSRIIISGTEPYIEYANAFKNAGKFDVEASHIKVTFNALDEYNNYPIVGGTQYVTDNTKGVTTPISNDIKLDKDNVYNDDQNALEVSKLTGMYAYYDVFDGLRDSDFNITSGFNADAVRQAFAIVSDAFDTQIKTALDGITAAVYSNNSIVNPVIIGDDKTIAVGSGDGKEDSEFNGFVIRLGNDYLHVNKNNLDGGNDFDKLGIFSLFDSVEGARYYTQEDNNVKVEFKGANNETIGWDNSTTNADEQSITVDMSSVNSSTLNITFTDATGIVYKQEIKIQKER